MQKIKEKWVSASVQIPTKYQSGQRCNRFKSSRRLDPGLRARKHPTIQRADWPLIDYGIAV
jgi:hypothetical protein